MYDVVYIFRGILIGLMVSVPLGPMGVLIIQKTLQKGALAGFVAGMGAACADLFYATVAAFGLGFVINVIQTHELILQIIGGIFLIIVGLKIYFDNPLKQIRMKKRVTKKGLLGDFLTLFFLTVSNPVAIVVFMAVFAGASAGAFPVVGLTCMPELPFGLAGLCPPCWRFPAGRFCVLFCGRETAAIRFFAGAAGALFSPSAGTAGFVEFS